MNNLTDKIERVREKLRQLILNKKLTDTQVVFCSQELDKLLSEYNKEIYS